MKIVLPAQNVSVDTPAGVDPLWYEKLQGIAGTINNGIIGQGLLPAGSTTGFGYMPTFSAAMGTPVAKPGYVPFAFDITGNKLWIWNGAWKSVTLT